MMASRLIVNFARYEHFPIRNQQSAQGEAQMKTTAEIVKELRESLGLTQEEFAYVFGLHPMTISKYERGILMPDFYQLVLFNELLKAKYSFNVKSYFYAHGPVKCFIKLCQCVK